MTKADTGGSIKKTGGRPESMGNEINFNEFRKEMGPSDAL